MKPLLLLSAVAALAMGAAAQTGGLHPGESDLAIGGISFHATLPHDWKAAQAIDKVILNAPDGGAYMLCRHSLSLGVGVTTRKLAEEHAGVVLNDAKLDSSRSTRVRGGSGAVFEFHGKNAAGEDARQDVWIATFGSQAVVLMPDPPSTTRLPDNIADLLMGMSIHGRVTGSGPGAAVRERLSGRMRATEVSFEVRLLSDGTAQMDWISHRGMAARFTGDYSERGAKAVVSLTKSSGNTQLGVSEVTLELHGLDGNTVTGTYVSRSPSVRGQIAEVAPDRSAAFANWRGRRC